MVNITQERNDIIFSYKSNPIEENIKALHTKKDKFKNIKRFSYETRLEYFRQRILLQDQIDSLFNITITQAVKQWYKVKCHPEDLQIWLHENNIDPYTYISGVGIVYFESEDMALLYKLASDLDK